MGPSEPYHCLQAAA